MQGIREVYVCNKIGSTETHVLNVSILNWLYQVGRAQLRIWRRTKLHDGAIQ